jgi:hypothetical protein
MKCTPAISAAVVLGLAACDTMNRPITTGNFDPLRPPGDGNNSNMAVGPAFKAGQFVRASMDNTAFFKVRPKGDGDADKLLSRGTSMKVISTADSYVKVELDSGEIGFVPGIMLEDPNTAAAPPAGTYPVNPNEIQVYPPMPGFGEPLPTVKPGEMPPEGSIPTVIDPEAPATNPPVPPVTPPTDTFPAPVEPKPGPTPLPPNGEEEEETKETKVEVEASGQ